MESGELHEKVVDKDSFIAFVRALAAERERAEPIERAQPLKHMLDGPVVGRIQQYRISCMRL